METERNTTLFYARVAGLSYIIFVVCGVIKNFLLNTKRLDIHDIQAAGVFVNEMHYRLGIGIETLMFFATLMASVALYVVLKTVNKQLALLALCFRLCEIILGSLVVLACMAMLTLSTKTFFTAMFDTEQLRILVAIINSFRMPAFELSWMFMGVAGVITFSLFFQSRYVPRFWAVWGIFTYSSLILYPLAKILIPNLPREVMFVMYPGALFELGIGIWLLAIGINMPSKIYKEDAVLG